MIKNITIGQYFPGDSVIHRANATVKLILATAYMILLFTLSHEAGMILGLIVLLIGYKAAKIPYKTVFKSIRPMIVIMLITGILNLFLIDGEVIFKLGFLSITREGVRISVAMVVRIICLVAGTSLMTYTTTPIELTDGIEFLLGPLKKIKVPVHELAMIMTIALRFIPTLIDETDKIMSAQKARGANFDTGKILDRAKALLPILIPLFISSFRRAEELALAMESRCYRGGEGRTRLKEAKFTKSDVICILFMVIVAGAIIVFQSKIPPLI